MASKRKDEIAEKFKLPEKRRKTAKSTGEEPDKNQHQKYGRVADWKDWGPYLSERQWGTVREDCSSDGKCWDHFSHEQATYRAYHWGEDGLMGISDSSVSLCLALALWNGKDPMLKERMYGLTGPQGNHGEDVKELYYYLDSSPNHSYMKGLYKYPQKTFPYNELLEENNKCGLTDPEYEILDTGIFDDNKYWDIEVEVAKASPHDILVKYTVHNRGSEPSTIHILPTLWYRNTWSWGKSYSDHEKPSLTIDGKQKVMCYHPTIGQYQFVAEKCTSENPEMIFTENETNMHRLLGHKSSNPGAKDAFHHYVVHGKKDALKCKDSGTKCAALYCVSVPAGGKKSIRCRLTHSAEVKSEELFGEAFNAIFENRKSETDNFYNTQCKLTNLPSLTQEQKNIARQACAGLLWTKQFFFYHVHSWLQDSSYPRSQINKDWSHMENQDIISMPDKWEFPWYATWDLAFHMIPFAYIDPDFAKDQLLLLLSDRYMHPSGQLPAYEFNFSDVNPPVHAWAVWETYQLGVKEGCPDVKFLKTAFHRLIINFTWWVNKKSIPGHPHLYGGGFLGLDNISAVHRSELPEGSKLIQADGTGWMAFYCAHLFGMALELADQDNTYEDLANKFLHHYLHIVDALQDLWDSDDGLFYDHLLHGQCCHILRIHSLVSLVPMFAIWGPFSKSLEKHPSIRREVEQIQAAQQGKSHGIARTNAGDIFLTAIDSVQMSSLLHYMFDEKEFLSDYGIRAVSKIHAQSPVEIWLDGQKYSLSYTPGESSSSMFGGNSNWRGPIWLCMNYLLGQSLKMYNHCHPGCSLSIPTGTDTSLSLKAAAKAIATRIASMFLKDEHFRRPIHGDQMKYTENHWKDLVLFYEYFHGDTGKGCGASHQTGWTSLIANFQTWLVEDE